MLRPVRYGLSGWTEPSWDEFMFGTMRFQLKCVWKEPPNVYPAYPASSVLLTEKPKPYRPDGDWIVCPAAVVKVETRQPPAWD